MDATATTANQSLTSGSTATDGFNILERAGIPGEHFTIDLADSVDPLRRGVWPVSRDFMATTGTAGFATPDGVHLSQTLCALIRDRGLPLISKLFMRSRGRGNADLLGLG